MPDVKALLAYKKSAAGHRFVSNNGTGIPADIKDSRLFSAVPYPQADRRKNRSGLSINYDIVTQEHGDTIIVDKRVGGFTEFTVRLPRAYGRQ